MECAPTAESWLKEVETVKSFCPQNPALTVSKMFLDENELAWSSLNLSKHIKLFSLNDDVLWEAVFGTESGIDSPIGGTNYNFDFEFTDAFHHYVMDRVYRSAWLELCNSMAAARSLEEVIEVHDPYLLSIQRQCFVVPDKLWALIASRINTILGLFLDFYNIQQTLSSGGAVSTIKARCEMEVHWIEKQFGDCIAFLLRVFFFFNYPRFFGSSP